jgi:hypothetical protein
MTKKDYQALAGVLHRALGHSSTLQWCADVSAVADTLAADNPRFDRETFITACETGDVMRRPKG